MGATVETIAQVILQLVQLGPAIIKTVDDAKPFVEEFAALLRGGTEPTQDDLDALKARIDDLYAQAQAPLPPADQA